MIDTAKGLKIMHLNIRSLVPKIDILKVWVAQHSPDILTLSETWLHSHICDSEIMLNEYKLYRADRESRGGGVAIYVSSRFVSEPATPAVTPSLFEGIFVKLKLHVNKHLTIGSIYRPPPVHPRVS